MGLGSACASHAYVHDGEGALASSPRRPLLNSYALFLIGAPTLLSHSVQTIDFDIVVNAVAALSSAHRLDASDLRDVDPLRTADTTVLDFA